jgi:glycolate oxidase iron-sulfur subunit
MRTDIAPHLLQEPDVKNSEQVLRACVHCGFCNATCPTYLLTGNELEGPRGRIYLIKSALEDRIKPSRKTLEHIDNCLGCLSCETTCPSGVDYSRLLEEARPRLDKKVKRAFSDRFLRRMLTFLLPHPGRFRFALKMSGLGRVFSFMLPKNMKPLLAMAPKRLPRPAEVAKTGVIAAQGEKRMRVALLTGCVQSLLGPQINDATVRLLTRLGAEVVIPKEMGCCGALTFHMGERKRSRKLMEHNIDVWHKEIEGEGLDAIVLNTSGCGTVVREYDYIFRHDPQLADKAKAVVERVRDVSEIVAELGLGEIKNATGLRVAYHDACSLQHGQHIKNEPRNLLAEAGFAVVEVPEGHICCGSAGTYNMLQPEMAKQLQERKAAHVESVEPQMVAAGNIGCMEQIGGGTKIPVVHTVELLDWATGGPRPANAPRE